MRDEGIGVRQGTQEANVYPQQIYAAIADGKLKAERLENGHWRISRASFDSWNRKLQTRRELAASEQEAVHAIT